ncbi:hypothetical protein CF327_g1409, partial [Tilletia walkeri]
CYLPQDICGRRNADVNCDFKCYKDAVRGILMFLTAYQDAYDAAIEVATFINRDYELEQADQPLRMPPSWGTGTTFLEIGTYTAFQAVAGILFSFAGQI